MASRKEDPVRKEARAKLASVEPEPIAFVLAGGYVGLSLDEDGFVPSSPQHG